MKRGACNELNSRSVQDFYEIPLNDETTARPVRPAP